MVDGITGKAMDYIVDHLNKTLDHWTEFAISDYEQDPNTGAIKFVVEWSYNDEETGEEYDDGTEWVSVSADAFSIQEIRKDL